MIRPWLGMFLMPGFTPRYRRHPGVLAASPTCWLSSANWCRSRWRWNGRSEWPWPWPLPWTSSCGWHIPSLHDEQVRQPGAARVWLPPAARRQRTLRRRAETDCHRQPRVGLLPESEEEMIHRALELDHSPCARSWCLGTTFFPFRDMPLDEAMANAWSKSNIRAFPFTIRPGAGAHHRRALL